MAKQRGLLISFEGTDGAGKSTQIARLKQHLEQKQMPCLLTREPGGTPLGEQLRSLALSPEYPQTTPMTELLLMIAARIEHIAQVIEPALAAGSVVISDRFADASVAYQGYGGVLGAQAVVDMHRQAEVCLTPDLTVFLDIDVATGLKRTGASQDRFEQKGLEFMEKVRQGYLDLARQNPERFVCIDANQSIEQVFAQIQEKVDHVLCSTL